LAHTHQITYLASSEPRVEGVRSPSTMSRRAWRRRLRAPPPGLPEASGQRAHGAITRSRVRPSQAPSIALHQRIDRRPCAAASAAMRSTARCTSVRHGRRGAAARPEASSAPVRGELSRGLGAGDCPHRWRSLGGHRDDAVEADRSRSPLPGRPDRTPACTIYHERVLMLSRWGARSVVVTRRSCQPAREARAPVPLINVPPPRRGARRCVQYEPHEH